MGNDCPPLQMKILAADPLRWQMDWGGPAQLGIGAWFVPNGSWPRGREEPLNGAIEPWKNLSL
jgi:hypothetical protein